MTTQAPPSAPPIAVELRDVTVTFGDITALDLVSLAVRPGTITGLLGRNGAGKSTLLSLVGGLRRPTSGVVLVDGEDPFENALAAADTQLVRESGDAFESEKVRTTFAWYAELREHWQAGVAEELADAFELPVRTRVDRLSRGQRSMVGAIIGIASRAPLTIFDETYLGMDAANRQTFYDALLADYAAHPRTIVISSHLISEVERMFEDVVILDGGRALLCDDADAVRGLGLSLTGRADVVEALVAGHQVLSRTALGPTAQVAVLVGALDREGGQRASRDVDASRAELAAAARDAGVTAEGLSIQDLFVHLTRTTREGKAS